MHFRWVWQDTKRLCFWYLSDHVTYHKCSTVFEDTVQLGFLLEEINEAPSKWTVGICPPPAALNDAGGLLTGQVCLPFILDSALCKKNSAYYVCAWLVSYIYSDISIKKNVNSLKEFIRGLSRQPPLYI